MNTILRAGFAALVLAITFLLTAGNSGADFSRDANIARAANRALRHHIFVDGPNPLCSDDNPGTKNRPLCTIQVAADRSAPGSIIHVREGVYPEMVRVHISGAPGAPIRFVTDNQGHVVIDSPREAGFDLVNVTHIKIGGFEITGAWMPETATANAAELGRPAHGGGIRAVRVHKSVFARNVIHDNDAGIWLAESNANKIHNNVLYQNGEASVRVKRGHHNRIYNNLIFNNGTRERWGITFYCALGTKVYHNTVIEPSGGAIYIYEGTANLTGTPPGDPGFCIPSNDTQVYDNLGVVIGKLAGETAPLVIGSSTTTDRPDILEQLYGPLTNQYHHNLFYNRFFEADVVSWGDFAERLTFAYYDLLNLAEFQQKAPGYGADSLTDNPLFEDPLHNNFKLAENSPAKGQASDDSDLGVNFQTLPAVNYDALPSFWE
ncbi:MAG: right-handed parallel beta-helix repeat-containing protein [Chloroflexi bacterium]|nr:right-handed parallel beta-helix repeat-containing protein [Chloroflexota bacterium]